MTKLKFGDKVRVEIDEGMYPNSFQNAIVKRVMVEVDFKHRIEIVPLDNVKRGWKNE